MIEEPKALAPRLMTKPGQEVQRILRAVQWRCANKTETQNALGSNFHERNLEPMSVKRNRARMRLLSWLR